MNRKTPSKRAITLAAETAAMLSGEILGVPGRLSLYEICVDDLGGLTGVVHNIAKVAILWTCAEAAHRREDSDRYIENIEELSRWLVSATKTDGKRWPPDSAIKAYIEQLMIRDKAAEDTLADKKEIA